MAGANKQAVALIKIILLGSQETILGKKAYKEVRLESDINKAKLWPCDILELKGIVNNLRQVEISLDPVEPHEIIYEASEAFIDNLKNLGWQVDEF